MDNKVLDEAVEVALTAYVNSRGSYEGEVPASPDDIRAALLAALPVLLGEPRAFEAGIEIFRRRDAAERHISSWRLTETKIVPLYAPSLGEGDGR